MSLPPLPTHHDEARSRLPAEVYDYFATGAGAEQTLGEAEQAWSRFRLRPRVLHDVSTVDLTSRSVAGGAAASTALMAAPAQRVVYFDYDSFVIKDEFQGLLDGHAKVLSRQTAKRMVIEGHTDERGGREYNLALGQKRAEAVAKSLALLGVAERQIEAVSFGEERPASAGADEGAWSRNRRAELKDR